MYKKQLYKKYFLFFLLVHSKKYAWESNQGVKVNNRNQSSTKQTQNTDQIDHVGKKGHYSCTIKRHTNLPERIYARIPASN